MSGARRQPARAKLPLLDRLDSGTSESAQEVQRSSAEALSALRRSVQRDIEALLNARRRWRSWPRALADLTVSPLNFGVPDCTAGMFHDVREREGLRREIEDTIRRFEPRFSSLRVHLIASDDKLDTTLRLRIDALLVAEPTPEPVVFDTVVDAATSSVIVRSMDDV